MEPEHEAKRIAHLDGARGVAILLVFVAHIISGIFPSYRPMFVSGRWSGFGGGFTGVQLFFVLSGYLITRNLINEYDRNGKISFSSFYLRRLWRLYPALLVLCFVFGLYAYFAWPPNGWVSAEITLFYAMTYTTNLDFLFPGMKDSLWLRHTWSLSVEEQFYVLWPLMLGLSLKLGGRSCALIFCGLGITGFFAGRMIVEDKLINYEVLRGDALLIGCCIALTNISLNRAILRAGAIALLLCSLLPDRDHSSLFQLVTALASGAFLLYSEGCGWTSSRLLQYFGRISYSLYLWSSFIGRFGMPWYMTALLSVVIAHYSFNLIEQPCIAFGRKIRGLPRREG